MSPEAAARAKAKLEELKKLVEQRQQVQMELITKVSRALEKAKVVAPGLAAGGAVSVGAGAGSDSKAKRPSVTSAVPEAKRQRTDEADRRISEVWRKAGEIVRHIKNRQTSQVFQRPVDPIKDKVPDYFTYVTKPMDLGTIAHRLKERQYRDPRDFAADMRQVWANCRAYNVVGSMVRNYGDQLSDEWERKWAESNIEAIWDEAVLQKDPQNVSLDRKLAVSARQLTQRVNSIQSVPAADPSRTMTMVEKRKLSIAMAELQGEQLAEVLQIIAESLHHINPDDDDEIELDIDQLDNATLWKLRAFCDAVRNKQLSQRPPPPAGGGGGGGATSAGGTNSRPALRTESGSESDRYSAEQDVKGSNMVEQPHSQPNFVKNQRTAVPVDESVTAPKDKPAIATDKKSNKDVVLNQTAWSTDTSIEDGAGGAEGGGEAGGGEHEQEDELWDTFKSLNEREKQQKAEEEKRKKDLEQERERQREHVVAEARRAKEEEERKMKEAEEAAAEEARRHKEEARKRELEELQKEANTAQVYRPPDPTTMAQFDTGAADMNELGLAYRQDDTHDDGFDD